MSPTVSSAGGFLLVGFMFVVITLVSTLLKRLYLTSTILYLGIGVLLRLCGIIRLDAIDDAASIRLLTEIAVTLSLFTAGLKLKIPLTWSGLKVPLTLATVSMAITIGLVALSAHQFLGLDWGVSLLLGAILAPTDPVLASSVQVLGPEDADRLRFNLTAEAGLNDGTAFPFVMLGLGLMNVGSTREMWLHWLGFDLALAIAGGLAIGFFSGRGIGKLVVYLRARGLETENLDDFLGIGLIGITYGVAVLLNVYGFLAVFMAGLALRDTDQTQVEISGPMTRAALKANEQLERIGELGIVILTGAIMSGSYFEWSYLGVVAILFFVIRPLSVYLPLRFAEHAHRRLLAWFGIRGIGLIYYLSFAIERGMPFQTAKALTGVTLLVILASIFLHGLTAAPLMLRYTRLNPAPQSRVKSSGAESDA